MNFANDLPEIIKDRDFVNNSNTEYSFSGYSELRFPEDFNRLNDKESPNLITKAIEITTQDQFTIDTVIRYDYPYSLFEFHLFEQNKGDNNNVLLEEAVL